MNIEKIKKEFPIFDEKITDEEIKNLIKNMIGLKE